LFRLVFFLPYGIPGVSSSYTPNLLAYTQAFTDNNPNYAAAIAVILAVGTFILSFGFLELVQRRGAAA